MAHDLNNTPVSPAVTSVSVPDGGDNRTAASVDTPMQAIWSALLWLYGVLTGSIAQGLTVNGFIGTVGHDITADGDLVATHDVIADHDVHAIGDVIADGNSTAVTGFTTPGFLVVGGNATVSGTLNVGGTLTTGTLSPTSITASGTVSGAKLAGKVIGTNTAGVNADQTITLSAIDSLNIPFSGSPLTADRIYTISDSGGVDGMVCEIANYDPSHSIKLMGLAEYPSGLFLQNQTGVLTYLKLRRISGVWTTIVAQKSFL